MSLHVYLIQPGEMRPVDARIFIREGGQNKEITREEWDVRFPGTEPVVMTAGETDEVYSANITGNLYRMAEAATIGGYLWEPETLGVTTAAQLIAPLTAGLIFLQVQPDKYKAFNPKNGWGTYEILVKFVEDYIAACTKYPMATVQVSR